MDTKSKLIATIIDKGDFKYNEPPHLINADGTDVIVFASDLTYVQDSDTIVQKHCLGEKARQAVEYPLNLGDAEVFNALRYIPECVNDSNVDDYSYITIGLYLMLADAVSRRYDSTNHALCRTIW